MATDDHRVALNFQQVTVNILARYLPSLPALNPTFFKRMVRQYSRASCSTLLVAFFLTSLPLSEGGESCGFENLSPARCYPCKTVGGISANQAPPRLGNCPFLLRPHAGTLHQGMLPYLFCESQLPNKHGVSMLFPPSCLTLSLPRPLSLSPSPPPEKVVVLPIYMLSWCIVCFARCQKPLMNLTQCRAALRQIRLRRTDRGTERTRCLPGFFSIRIVNEMPNKNMWSHPHSIRRGATHHLAWILQAVSL